MGAPDTPDETPAATSPAEPDRFSLTALPRTTRDLEYLSRVLGLGRTDAVNRAVQLYAFIQREIENGHQLAIHRPAEDETQLVHVA